MKHLLATLSLFALTAAAGAQERIPADEAQRIAKILVEHAEKADNPPLKVEVDADKPFGIRHNEIGTMVIPGKDLSADTFAKAGKDVTPVAHLWFRKIAPAAGGKVSPNDKLRIVAVNANGQELMLPLCVLGVRKAAGGELELVVLGKDKEPLAKLPLKKIDAQQELPIEMEGKKGDNEGTLTLNLLGKYQAVLTVMEQES